MIQKLNNGFIYDTAIALTKMLKEFNQYIPAKVNFILCKNTNLLQGLAEEIEDSRKEIILHYGEMDPTQTDTYTFNKENISIANKELMDLINFTQEIDIYMLKLSDLEGLNFTPSQMQTLLFMIEES